MFEGAGILDLAVTAERVETAEQLGFLVQGYRLVLRVANCHLGSMSDLFRSLVRQRATYSSRRDAAAFLVIPGKEKSVPWHSYMERRSS